MDKARFWQLIDSSRDAAGGDPEEQLATLEAELSRLQPDDIVAFDQIFSSYHARAYQWDLWGAAYVIGGGCSDDGFMDFRGWLISRGEKVYEAALTDPDTLAAVVQDGDGDCQIEGFQYLASRVWKAKTGRSTNGFPRGTSEHPSVPTGTDWVEGDLPQRFPKLSERFA